MNGIIRQHPRSRLYVRPILWTADHLRLLNCHFAVQERRPKKKSIQRHGSYQFTRLANRLSSASGAAAQKLAIMSLLAPCGVQPFCLSGDGRGLTFPFRCLAHSFLPKSLLMSWSYSREFLSFYFDSRIVDDLRTDGIFSYDAATPALAFVNLDTVRSLRDMSVNGSYSKRPNGPVASLGQKKLDLLKPPNEPEDPYLAAVLISLAQEQRWRQQQQREAGIPVPIIPHETLGEAGRLYTDGSFRVSGS